MTRPSTFALSSTAKPSLSSLSLSLFVLQVYALHAGNCSSELSALDNLRANINPGRLPILPALLGRSADSGMPSSSLHGNNGNRLHQLQSQRQSPALMLTLEDRYDIAEDLIMQVGFAAPVRSYLSECLSKIDETLSFDTLCGNKDTISSKTPDPSTLSSADCSVSLWTACAV